MLRAEECGRRRVEQHAAAIHEQHAGADLARILWLSFQKKPAAMRGAFISKERERRHELKAAELLLEASGFGLVVIDQPEEIDAG